MDKPNRADFVVACRMKRVGLIRNPRSRGNRGPANGFTSRAQEWLGPCFVEVASPHDMREVLADFERRGVGLLIVDGGDGRSAEHKSELQSLMPSTYACFCL